MADARGERPNLTFDTLVPEGLPCFEPARPLRHRRPRCRSSLSIVPLVLSPTVCVMVAVALIAWFMIHNTASDAVEAVGHQGQQMFVVAMREGILAYTAVVQRAHSINRPRWENTTCDGTSTAPNVSAFDAYDDVRLALWSQVLNVGEPCCVAVAFPCGSFLGYQLTNHGFKWATADSSTGFWLRKIQSDTWREEWASGPDSWTLPDGVPLNMTTRLWFSDAVRNGNQSWSAILYTLRNEFVLPAVMPIYHPDGRLKLVAEAEISIQELDSFFTALKLTPNTFAFVSELDGNLVASSPEGLSTALPANQSSTGALLTRVAAQDAADVRIAGAAVWLVARFRSLAGVPAQDSNFMLQLAGESHYLFTGHVTDRYGLHWVIVIGLPRSDLLQSLDEATVWAIVIIVGLLLASMVVIGAVTLMIRRNLQLFAKRIKLMGTLDLEGARQLEGGSFLSETRLILLNLRETIGNLQQFRTFLPPTMLDKVRLAETPEDPEGQPPQLGRLSSSGVLRAARSPLQDEPSQLIRPTLLTSCISPDNSLQTAIVLRDTASSSTTYISRPPHFHSIVHTMLERRMENLSITLVCLELPNLHSTQEATWTVADFMGWYEACLSTALSLLQKCHGDFYRLMGDQLLFSWGAMRRVAAQCSKACHAAWQLLQALRALDTQATMSMPYAPRLSVVTGTALCGVMGTDTTRDTYLIGPLVKLGVRLASLNGPYDTHILVDVGVAKQCETLFQMQVCGLIHGIAVADPRPVQPVFELVSPAPEDGELPRSTAEEEWMYRLAAAEGSRSGYELAMDALRRGLVSQAKQSLEDFLALKPDDRHARRMLERIHSQSVDSTGLDGIVD